MIRAAICEDEIDIAKYVEKTLSQEFIKHGMQIEFETYTNGNRFLETVNDHYHYDIVFMDIEMPAIDGISICREIRKISSETLVVFISNKEELVFSTFEVQPFRFIRKSHYDALLPELVLALQTEIQRRQPQTISIIEPGSKDLFSFDVNQITHIEAQGKNCCIHTTDGETILKTKLMELESQLEPFDFIKPHRSYLVHCKFIATIHKSDIELMDKSLIPISRGHVEDIKTEFLKYTNRSV